MFPKVGKACVCGGGVCEALLNCIGGERLMLTVADATGALMNRELRPNETIPSQKSQDVLKVWYVNDE